MSSENREKRLLVNHFQRFAIRLLNRLVIGFLLVKVNWLVNGVLSGFVSQILTCYLYGCVEDDGMGNEVIRSE